MISLSWEEFMGKLGRLLLGREVNSKPQIDSKHRLSVVPVLSSSSGVEWTWAQSKHFYCTNKNMNLSSMTILPDSSGLAQPIPVNI